MLRILFSAALLLNFAVADNSNKIKLIKDFLDSEVKPTNLIVWKNCFEESDKVEMIGNSFTPTIFVNKESLNASGYKMNPQHCLFMLDLTCKEDPENIIGKVKKLLIFKRSS